MTDFDIPKQLIDEILKGNVILFLGAGASFGATHPRKQSIPLGNKLRDLLVGKFLDETYSNDPLAHVAEVCINESDLFEVQAYVKDIFNDFGPAEHHQAIVQYKWRAIYTTNYDLVVERAYENQPISQQELRVFVNNAPTEKLFSDTNNVLYFKLHGCIRYSADVDLPLVLSLDQYASVHNKRDRLFSKLEELASDYTCLFVGYSNTDSDIRDVFNKLEKLKSGRPRSYFVVPNIRPGEVRMLEGKKITALSVGFKDFMEKLENVISPSNKLLSSILTTNHDHPIYRKFVNETDSKKVSASFITYVTKEIDFVHPAIPSENTDAKEFYKGYFVNWDPIIRNLDIERKITDNILLKVFLDGTREEKHQQQFHIIKGNAGSGKSVLLKRIAWKAAIEHDKLCLFYKPNARLNYDNIYETYMLCKERMYIFIDNIIQYAEYIVHVLSKARRDKLPLTIIGCVRNNEYNMYTKGYADDDEEIAKYLTEAYDLTYLNNEEIRELIVTLGKHKSLGHLEGKPFEEQVEAFSKQFGRELLVALYEATLGKSFAEIITDEYNGISSHEAQSLYLTVSILHRLGCKARAGFISRMHNISLSDFKERLFGPLEHIVFDYMNDSIGDFEYSTRHQQIAEMVFNNILKTEADRFNEYLRIISYLDVDYENDRSAFRAMVNARKLKELFGSEHFRRSLYKTALERSTNDAYLLQQAGLFELSVGKKEASQHFLNLAKSNDKNNLTITHSLAEYEYKLGEESGNKLVRESHLSRVVEICNKTLKQAPNNSSFYHTLLKVSFIRLEDFLKSKDTLSIERHIDATQKLLSESIRNCGEDAFLLDADSRFHKMINDSPTALSSLERAYQVNKRNAYISLRLSKYYEYNGNIDRAIDVLAESVKLDEFNKELNHKLGLLIFKKDQSQVAHAIYHLKRSFTPGDSNHQAQYDYAKFSFLHNDVLAAKDVFDRLKDLPISYVYKSKVRDIHKVQGVLISYEGAVERVGLDYAIIKTDGAGKSVYARLKKNTFLPLKNRVKFNLGFNYYGPIAVNMVILR